MRTFDTRDKPAAAPRRARLVTPTPRLAARGIALLGVLVGMLAASSSALAAGPAGVATGPATQVSYGSAVLTGTVNPNGSETSYYFQYGLTRDYGAQSAIASVGAGSHQVAVSLPIAGLQPLTAYHYRLVAVNTSGAEMGADHVLLTTKVPLSLAILAAPSPVSFDGTITVQGTLSGTGNGEREVLLQEQPFGAPAFQNVGNPELTTPTGTFSFAVFGIQATTTFRVVTATNPPVASPVTVASVAPIVRSHVARARRRGFARLYGTVVPAENGAEAQIVRFVHGRLVVVATTTLHPATATSSSFSRVIRARPGVYRVLAVLTGRPQVSSYSQPLAIR